MLPKDLSERACPNPSCSQFEVKGAGNVYMHGNTARGVPRFRCVTCKRTFSTTTGTAMHGLRHEAERVVDAAGQVLLGGTSYREAARENGVSHQSVMRWVEAFRSRPDFLSGMEKERREALPTEVKALLAHGVEAGLITASEAEATELEIIRGDLRAYRSLLARLIERHGSYWKLVMALFPDQV